MKLYPIYTKAPLTKDWQSFFKNSKQELRKQEAKAEENNKTDKEIDQAGLIELVKELVKIIEAMDEKFTNAIEAIAEKLDEISEVQSERPYGRAPVEPTKKDLEVIEKQIEQLGLCGEVRKILPFEFVRGRFVEKP